MASKEFVRGFATAVAFVSKTLNLKEGSGSSYQMKRIQLDAEHGMLPSELEKADKPTVLPAPGASDGASDDPEDTLPAPKRTRRTKAQIEADKLAAQQEAAE